MVKKWKKQITSGRNEVVSTSRVTYNQYNRLKVKCGAPFYSLTGGEERLLLPRAADDGTSRHRSPIH